MGGQLIGSAKKNLPYHNTLILHKSKKQTVKDQLEDKRIRTNSQSAESVARRL
jgi:hypothetical protein